MRLVVGAELPRALALRVLDRGPRPPVALDERASFVGRVGDVDPEVGELRVTLLKLCVGDRLALAGASPRRPHVDEDRAAAEVREREALSVERDPLDRRCKRAA